MSSLSARLSSVRTKFWPSLNDLGSRLAVLAALLLLLVYITVVVLAYRSTQQPGSLTFRISRNDPEPHVSWVMPAGLGWEQGVRPGMKVVSIDGVPVTSYQLSSIPAEPAREAVLLTPGGRELQVKVTDNAISHGAARSSLWAVGGVLALLGAAVVLRRPDSYTARMFVWFAGFSAIALAVGPSAGGPTPPWAITIQLISVTGIAATFPLFISVLLEQSAIHRRIISIFVGLALIIALVYGVAVLFRPSMYEVVRPVLFLYFSLSFLVSIALLATKATRKDPSASREQARICLWGTALGAFPFLSFTLIPQAAGQDALFPSYITVLPFVLIPISFAYAIMEHQLLGIRKLVHRGMVYTITTLVLLAVIVLGSVAGVHAFGRNDSNKYPYLLVPILIVIGIVIFPPLRKGARRLVDRFIYKDTADYQTFFETMPKDMLTFSRTSEVAKGITQRLAQMLNLESALLFLGQDPSSIKLIASGGERAQDISSQLDWIEPYIKNLEDQDVVQLARESDSFLLVNLKTSDQRLGYILLGPKKGGEIFVETEKRLVATMMPILALAIDKAELSQELRELNQLLLKAEETERSRIAGDLHDGPLQKVIFLATDQDAKVSDQKEIVRQIISEIREICSRLRPAVLDDLGIVPALQWLLDGTSKRSQILTRLSLNDISEDDRFSPDIEQVLFRVTQEAINNALKHSKAMSLNVSLSRDADSLVLQVTDDGVGFSPSSSGRSGFGLSGMRERVVQVDGSFYIKSALGQGTIVTAHIPLGEYPDTDKELSKWSSR